jgi:acid phosphatase
MVGIIIKEKKLVDLDYSTLNTVEHNWDLGNLGQQDTNKTVSNVFKHLSKKLHYHNVEVPANEIPWSNNTITGLLTGKSWNQTHAATTKP